jgi:hypothetical protein
MKILLNILMIGSIAMADLIRDDDRDVVIDTASCLMWIDNYHSMQFKKNWEEAINYCEDLDFAGFTDWRLPNFNELYSIGDKSEFTHAIKDPFIFVENNFYWSSTTNVFSGLSVSEDSALVVDFENCKFSARLKNNDFNVRCVRDTK